MSCFAVIRQMRLIQTDPLPKRCAPGPRETAI